LIVASSTFAQDKLSSRLQMKITADPAHVQTVWIYVNNTAISDRPIVLSEQAIKRRGRVDADNYLIDKNDFPVSLDVVNRIRSQGIKIRGVSRWLKAVAAEADSAQLRSLSALSFVKRIDLIHTFSVPTPPEAVPLRRQQQQATQDRFDYGSSLMQNQFTGAVRLHNAGLSGRGVRIAIFDTGFRTDHEAFDSTTIVATWDFINNDSVVDDPECPVPLGNSQIYHGTLVFGTIGGYLPGELIGSAPEAEYLLAKTEITCNGTEIKREEDNWILAAEWADSAGADIISSSLGYTQFTDSGSYQFSDRDGDTPLITAAADIAASKNILVVNAAGNMRQYPWGHIVAPADGDSVIAVGALFADSQLAPFSSPGPSADGRIKPDIASLGVDVVAAFAPSGVAMVSGPSLATPLVAGCAALALEHDSTLTADELRTLIRRSGDRFEHPDNDFGYGIFDAVRTADIIHIITPDSVTVRINQLRIVEITTGGRSSVTPALSAFDLPPTAQFTDHGDGSGTFEIVGSKADSSVLTVGVIADVGYFADTGYITIETLSELAPPISVGPNPFDESIRIIIAPQAGSGYHIAIFNMAGEKVWERVNETSSSSDIIVRWDGYNSHGKRAAAGVYIIRVQTDKYTEEIKVLKTG